MNFCVCYVHCKICIDYLNILNCQKNGTHFHVKIKKTHWSTKFKGWTHYLGSSVNDLLLNTRRYLYIFEFCLHECSKDVLVNRKIVFCFYIPKSNTFVFAFPK